MEYYRYSAGSLKQVGNPLFDFPPDGDFYNEYQKAEYIGLFSKPRHDPYQLPFYTVYQNSGTYPELPLYFLVVNNWRDREAWYFADDLVGLKAIAAKVRPCEELTALLLGV